MGMRALWRIRGLEGTAGGEGVKGGGKEVDKVLEH
jgi:hypothetical protein